MAQRSPVATDVAQVFDDLGAVADRVRKRAEAELESAESAEALPAADARSARLARAAREARGEALLDGARGLEKLAQDPGTQLTPAEEFGLEAIVLLEGRPALLVQGGDFGTPPAQWTVLDAQRAAIRDSIARVGRVEVTGHPDFDWVGTGFLVGPGLVMTNRHVALEFARGIAGAWTFISGRASSVDLVREAGSADRLEFTVTEVVGIHDADDVDLALLRVEPRDDGALPSPLRIAAVAPDDVIGRQVYVVGYPAWDGRRNEPEPMRRIFMDLYNVKRLQPGRTTASADPAVVLRHDCSTLGGNSGSPVFDLATHRVLGLHFGGRYGVGNFAVPAWRLVDDPLTAGAGINFDDALVDD
ncbi:serine protease [Jiangella aurantiaca]|uniref:Serine protease n=1 Tax=Jiangella aurantiaca TaxID=2530373 RepID=A0A4R5A218_9ACTN|nr:serine protease [Jiangella aurantiaca]TDD65475.1 serine protease [Jiangella aurantiaca]